MLDECKGFQNKKLLKAALEMCVNIKTVLLTHFDRH